MTVLGQIGCDSNGKLNARSVILEGDQEHSSGGQVPVDVSELAEYSLFPGQVRHAGYLFIYYLISKCPCRLTEEPA